ncbi:GIY-YIG nuclease family protein [Candidatus Peregrinibacteria bacterium]|nr:MAG: GIY-YIG nuclease family protein [Candidatus Peregrinibacteria bacterium]
MEKLLYFVYIMASDSGTLYVGVTNDLERRVLEHKEQENPESFTAKYHCHKLVYYEESEEVVAAIEREKQIKKWRREKKQNLIKTVNPKWKDLSEDWYD